MRSNPSIPAPLLVDERGAARLLQISPRSMWALGASGAIQIVKINRSKRYAISDLHAYIEMQKKKGGEQ